MYSRFRTPDRRLRIAALLCAAGALCACQRSGETAVSQAPADRPSVQGTAVSTLFPGGGSAPPDDPTGQRYAGDPHAIAEGARLFDWYNCSGCHFHGAGGIGPAFMDAQWLYGGRMQQIYASIYQGRPNGMPSWGGKLSTTEIWEIAAYVHSLSVANAATAGEPVPPPPAVAEGGAREPADAPMPSASEIKAH